MKTLKPFVFALAIMALPGAVLAQETISSSMSTVTTESVGTISEVSPDSIVIRSETTSTPTNYSYTKKTTYVDETGAPVSMETVKSGLPVTVYYTREGDRMVADKVMVRKTTTTTTDRPGIQEKSTRTSTTTETKY
jgi:hypothetical protein